MPTTDDVLSEIVDTLGRLPERWWWKWEARGEYYEDGRKKIGDLTEEYQEVKPLAVRIGRIRSTPPAAKKAEQLSEEDQVGLRLLLEGCLRYEPGERRLRRRFWGWSGFKSCACLSECASPPKYNNTSA